MSVRILLLYSKGKYSKLPHISMSLDLTQYLLGCFYFSCTLSIYLGCMVSLICDDSGIQLLESYHLEYPRVMNPSIKNSYHGIWFPRSNLSGCLLLCLILCLDWGLEIISICKRYIPPCALPEKKRSRKGELFTMFLIF